MKIISMRTDSSEYAVARRGVPKAVGGNKVRMQTVIRRKAAPVEGGERRGQSAQEDVSGKVIERGDERGQGRPEM